jgi:uncharacterized membrane protein YfhO
MRAGGWQKTWHRLAQWGSQHRQIQVLLLLLAVWVFVFQDYLFFRQALVSDQVAIDTISQFFPIEYYRLSRLLSATLPFWSFQFDLGANVYPLMVDTNPFDLIYLLFGADHFIQAMPLVFLLKFLAAGLFFYAFLTRIDIAPLPAAVGALLYTFSGYMVINSHWYHYSNYAVFMAVFLFLFERWLQQGKWFALVLVLGLLSLKAELQLFQMACFGSVYVLYRGVQLFGWSAALIRLFGLLGLFFGLGVLLGAYEYLPNLAVVFSSSRVEGVAASTSTLEAFLQYLQPVSWHDLQGYLARFLAADMLGAWTGYRGPTNYFEFSSAYVGILAVLLFPLGLRHCGNRRNLLWLFPLVFLLVLLFPTLRLALNGFASGTFKYLSLYCAVFVLLPATVSLNHLLRHPERREILLAAAWAGLVFLALAAFLLSRGGGAETPAPGEPLLVFDPVVSQRVLFVAAAYLAFLAGLLRWPRARAVRLLLLLLVVVEVALFSRQTVARNQGALDPFFVQRQENFFNAATAAALQRIEAADDSFYRIEKGYVDGHLNDALIQNYFGTTAYYGFVAAGIVDFYQALGLSRDSRRLASYRYGLEKRLPLQALLRVKYFLCRTEAECQDLEGFVPVDTVAGIQIYQNRQVEPFGRVYRQRCPTAAFHPLSPAEKDALLLRAVVSDLPLAGLAENCQPPFNESPIGGTATTAEALELLAWDEEHFHGRVALTEPGLVFFPIPFDRGWALTVNGQAASLLKVNFGFSGALLPAAGEYRLSLVYTPPYLLASILISLFALAVAVGIRLRWPEIFCDRPGLAKGGR